jgi:hypothetical protein
VPSLLWGAIRSPGDVSQGGVGLKPTVIVTCAARQSGAQVDQKGAKSGPTVARTEEFRPQTSALKNPLSIIFCTGLGCWDPPKTIAFMDQRFMDPDRSWISGVVASPNLLHPVAVLIDPFEYPQRMGVAIQSGHQSCSTTEPKSNEGGIEMWPDTRVPKAKHIPNH